jgi:uncharacterized Zn-finger protein
MRYRVIDYPTAIRIIVAAGGSIRARPASFSGLFMTPFETIYIDEMVAACNGGGGPLGHPRVYLNLAPSGTVECPYCSRQFVNRSMAANRAPNDTAPASGVATPSARGPGAAGADESPPPRQSAPGPAS